MKTLSDKAGFLIGLNIFKYSVGFLIPVALVRLLDQRDYGTYQQLLLLGNVVPGLMTLGLPASIYYFYTTADRARRHVLVLQTVLLLFGAGTLAAVVVALLRLRIAAAFDNPALVDLLPIYCLYIMFFTGSEYLIHVMISRGAYTVGVAVETIEIVIRSLILLGPMFLGGGLRTLIMGVATYAVSRYLSYLVLVRDDLFPIRAADFGQAFVRGQLAYSLPLAMAVLVVLVGNLIDKAIIALSFSPEQYAVYAVGAVELPLDTIFQASVANVLRATLPALAREGRLEEIARIFRAAVRKLATIILPIFVFMVVFSKPFIVLLFTERYVESVPVFRLYLLLVPLHIFVFSVIPQAFGWTKIQFYISLTAMLGRVIMTTTLLKLVGYYGVPAAAVGVSWLAGSLYFLTAMHLLHARPAQLFPALEVLRVLAVSGAAVAVAAIVFNLLPPGLPAFMITGILFLALYGLAADRAGVLSDEDRELIKRWVGRALRRA